MLHILLLILKILLWLMIGIIGLVIVLLCLVLFAPIRYRADLSYQGGKTIYVLAKIRYLIFRFQLLYNQEQGTLKHELKILCFNLKKKPEESVKADSKAEEEQPVKADSEPEEEQPVKADSEPEEEQPVKADSEAEKEQSVKAADGKAETEQPPEQDGKTEEFDLFEEQITDIPENEKKVSGRFRILCKKLLDVLKKIFAFFSNHTIGKSIEHVTKKVETKVHAIKRKANRLQKFWNLSCTVKTREYLKKYLKKTLHHILPRKIRGNIHFGMDEPYKTGQITGYLSLLPFMYQKGLTIQPDFYQKILELDLRLKGHITLGYIIRIVLNINVWRTIKVAKKIINSK